MFRRELAVGSSTEEDENRPSNTRAFQHTQQSQAVSGRFRIQQLNIRLSLCVCEFDLYLFQIH